MPDQEGLAAVAEVDPRTDALADEFYRRGAHSATPFKRLPIEHQTRWRDQAVVMLTYLDSLRASRQPVSGGPEGEVVAALEMLDVADGYAEASGDDTMQAMLRGIRASLSGSPACTCGNGEAEEDRGAVLRCPVHRQVCTDDVWPDESGVESGSLAGYRDAVPADGEQPE